MGKVYTNEFKTQVVEYYKTHTAKETAVEIFSANLHGGVVWS